MIATAAVLCALGFGALAVGILIGRYYVPDDRALKRAARHGAIYLRALNEMLARNRDGAIAELRRAVDENVDDVEPYFALGGLFRSRGEWERAIRVHQAIELRAAGDRRLALRARYALGLDFRAAGMPRRATRAMEDCLAEDSKHQGALRALCGLYEEQGRYAEAARAWRRLSKLGGEPSPREPHLLAAAAQAAVARGDLDAAKRSLRDAEKLGGASAHVHVAAAELAAARKNPRAARARLMQALEAKPAWAAFVVPALARVERAALSEAGGGDEPEEAEVARKVAAAVEPMAVADGADPNLRLAAAEVTARFDPDRALAALRALAGERPALVEAWVAAARLSLAGGDAAAIRQALVALVGDAATAGALASAMAGGWRCGHCGARQARFQWRCERCRQWGTARSNLGRDAFEPTPPGPRERRALPRGDAAEALAALPAPAAGADAEAGTDTDADTDAGGALTRAGARVAAAWSSIRGRRGGSGSEAESEAGE